MIDIRLNDFYEDRLKELATYHQEPTSVAVVRLLIRHASKEARLWPSTTDSDPETDQQPVIIPAGAQEPSTAAAPALVE